MKTCGFTRIVIDVLTSGKGDSEVEQQLTAAVVIVFGFIAMPRIPFHVFWPLAYY
jgi:primosomal replication protein N